MIQDYKFKFHEVSVKLCSSLIIFVCFCFFSVAEITLRSIFSQEYLRKMKFTHIQHQAYAEKYYERFVSIVFFINF